MRPTYETEQSRSDEGAYAEQLRTMGWYVEKMRGYFPCDFMATKRGQMRFIEYKRRNFDFGTYPSLMVGLKKMSEVCAIAELARASVVVACECDDGVYECLFPLGRHSFPIKIMGRDDRDDPEDREPYIMIPNCQFSKLGHTKPFDGGMF